jgi:hypothetical protein
MAAHNIHVKIFFISRLFVWCFTVFPPCGHKKSAVKDVRRSGIGSDVHAARAALRLPSDSPQTFVFQRSFSRPGIVRTSFGAALGLSKTLIFRA